MRFRKRYRLTLEDESSLQKKINFSTYLSVWVILVAAIVVCAGAFGMFILASTPLKNHLPGYLKETERTATEEQHIRLDSLVRVYEINEAYISNILNALNPPEKVEDIDKIEKKPTPLSVDSLLPPSDEERKFMEEIREREKFNIGYNPSSQGNTLIFEPVNKSAIISEDTENQYQAEIILPSGTPVATIAEGKVISVASSPKVSGGYEIIIQHPNGYLSKSSRLYQLMVKPGDRVTAGQIIASSPVANGQKGNHIILELWHDGDPLIPARYIKSGI